MTDEDPALLISSNCKQVATLVLLEGHEGYIDVAAWSPIDDVIVTGSSDRCHLLIETDVSKNIPDHRYCQASVSLAYTWTSSSR